MAGNSFGKLFCITTFGASHGPGVGVVIDGCPSGLEIDYDHLRSMLDRRRPGQSHIVTRRDEREEYQIISGIFEGKTTGTPLTFIIYNRDPKSKDYGHLKTKYRPSHADFTYDKKYGIRDYRGGGRSSARETVSRVIAGSIAMQILKKKGVEIRAFVSSVGDIQLEEDFDSSIIFEKDYSENIIRCPDEAVAKKMISLIEGVKKQGDTIGGVVRCIIRNVPVGLGEPVFDKLSADLGKAMLSINAVKGFEIGSGFSGTQMRGTEHNDIFENVDGMIRTKTNHSGGIQGGISNGMPITFNVAFKPVATILRSQESIDNQGNPVIVEGKGRHDPCVVPRAVPIVESMAAIVLLNHYLRYRATDNF